MAEYVESKKKGDIGEEEILIILQRKYSEAYIDETDIPNSDWDIFIPEINVGVEVKCDYESNNTGNIVIEVEMRGKLSALSVTKSKYWVFITGYRYIWIKPIEIYRFLEQHFEYGRVPITGSGDKSPKIGYLVNLNAFVKYIRNNLSKDDGWINMIGKNEVMYYDNYMKKIEEIK